ncbi:MAG: hypothetical protein ACP59X_14270 [Solidesulfovibrio sp. DCME]|uniref:hypothetical protein n=1 Tax=Solidesulfovibrio sp. DCME TaxID=3447380 RepID=UPI003D142AA1
MRERFDVSAAQEANRLGVNRTTMVEAIQAGRCGGENRDGYWYTSTAAAAKWYKEHYRHSGELYSQSAGKSWSTDLPRMREMFSAGKSVEDVAAALKRSPNAVKVKASKEGIRPRSAAKMAHALEHPSPPAAPPATSSPDLVAQARVAIAEDDRQKPPDWYKQRRQDDREGRLRIHVAPEVKRRLAAGLARINAARPEGERVTMAQFLSWAGLAAIEDEAVLERGRALASKL